MRLFIAIDLPDEIKKELWYLALHLGHQAEQARVVPFENYHLTLLFIGETRRVDEVREAFHRLRVPEKPVDFVLEGIGSFKQQRGRTWWVGVRANEVLAELAEELGALYRSAGFPLETRAFKPHITLARGVKASRPIELSAPFFEVQADRISLMKSVNEGGRMVYTEIDSLIVHRHPHHENS